MPDVIQLLNTPAAALFWGRETWVDQPGLVLVHDPARVETVSAPEGVPDLLASVGREMRAGRWVAGFVGYEGGLAFDLPTHAPTGQLPLAWMAAYDPANVQLLDPSQVPVLPRISTPSSGSPVSMTRL